MEKMPWRSDASDKMEHEGATMELWFPGSNVVCTKITGHFHHVFAQKLMMHFDEVMSAGVPIVVWHDWGDATGFDTKVKLDFTTWAMKHGKEIERVHVYAKSTFLRLGIKVSNLATGNLMRVYDSRSAFRSLADESLDLGHEPQKKAL